MLYDPCMATPYNIPTEGEVIRYAPAASTTGESVRIFTLIRLDKVGEGKSGPYIQGIFRDSLDGQERGRVLSLDRIEA
jgi:hypothetical protein